MRTKGISPQYTKQTNRLLVLRLLCSGQGLSRTEITRRVGLAKMTVSNITAELLRAGLIEEEAGGGALLDHGGQVPRRLGDAPEEGLVLDDVHILPHVGGGGGDLHELEDIGPGGVLVKDAVQAHLVQHRHRVHRLGEGEHGVDGLVDVPVLPEVEVLGAQLLDDHRDAPGVDEHGAQHRLLGLHRVGHLPGQQLLVHGHVPSPPLGSVFKRASPLRGGKLQSKARGMCGRLERRPLIRPFRPPSPLRGEGLGAAGRSYSSATVTVRVPEIS